MARRREGAAAASRMARTYVDGNAVRKTQTQRNTERYEQLRKRRELERDRILEEREKQYRAQQERLRNKSQTMDATALVIMCAALACTLVFCFSYIRLQTQINTRISSIESMKQQLDKLRSSNDALQNSIDTSLDLDNIYRVATQELGMVYADESQTITFDKTESEYVRQYEDIPKY